MKSLISENQFSKEYISKLFKTTEWFSKNSFQANKWLSGKTMATLFYEPSTRTRLSFESAMLSLGGNVVSTENASQFSSAIKGESLEDTIKIVSSYVDVIVLRHPEVNASERASKVSSVPVINAGSGNGSHPTQSLLDMFTIVDELGSLDLHFCFAGDLLHSRTIKSLIRLVSDNKVTFSFIGNSLDMDILNFIQEKKIPYKFFNCFYDIDFEKIDVYYLTRVQAERRDEQIEIPVFEPEFLKFMKEKSIIMHPLPRTKELPVEIDLDKRAVYFKQAKNGLWVRMAILYNLFSSNVDVSW